MSGGWRGDAAAGRCAMKCRVVGCDQRQTCAVILRMDVFDVDVLVCEKHFAQWVTGAREKGFPMKLRST